MADDARDMLVLFTHLPKAGGSSLGAMLGADARSPGEACHLRWNGLDREHSCGSLRSWLRGKNGWSARHTGGLPHGPGATMANASLDADTPFPRCKTLWAQHVDFSIVELARLHHPKLRIQPVMLMRHPVDLFFSEFLYKRHCLWRQQGRSGPDAASAISLSQHIARLRAQPERRTLLTRFLAGASWCSCATDWATRRALPERELRSRALANAATYAVLGNLARAAPSLDRIERLLGSNRSGTVTSARGARRGAGGAGKVNALAQCVDEAALPATDRPTDAQRAEVAALLATDVALYEELDRRFASPRAGARERLKGSS